MVTVKDTEKRTTSSRRTITCKDVTIDRETGTFVDDDGNIAQSVADALPEGIEFFSMKIVLELPDEECEEEY